MPVCARGDVDGYRGRRDVRGVPAVSAGGADRSVDTRQVAFVALAILGLAVAALLPLRRARIDERAVRIDRHRLHALGVERHDESYFRPPHKRSPTGCSPRVAVRYGESGRPSVPDPRRIRAGTVAVVNVRYRTVMVAITLH